MPGNQEGGDHMARKKTIDELRIEREKAEQDLKLGQGRDKSIDFLNVNLELRDEIEQQVRDFANDADSPILQFSTDEDDDDDVEYQRLDGNPSALDLDDDEDDDL